MGAHDYNKIGEDGEAYILWDGFYLVVYSASPEELDYALQESLAGEPVPCPEPYWQKLENNPACVVWNRYPKDWTVTWSGACVNGKAQGSGTQFVKDKEGKKSKYEGDYKGGKRHGRGVWVGANGNRYEGDFKDDKFHGSGVYVWANGNRYEGEVKDGQENGRGVYVWANGNRYEGEFKGNKPNGSGTLRKRDGRSYSGYWTNGCFKQGEQWATLFTTPIACGF